MRIADPLLLSVPREALEHLLRLALEAKASAVEAFLKESSDRVAAENALVEERQAAAFFRGAFDDAMTELERLAGRELPELVRRRAELKARTKGLREATRRWNQARQAKTGDPLRHLVERARAGEKREVLVAEAKAGGIARATLFRRLKEAGLTRARPQRGLKRSS